MAGHGNYEAADGNAAGLYKLAAHDTCVLAERHGLDIGISFFEVRPITPRMPRPHVATTEAACETCRDLAEPPCIQGFCVTAA